MDINKIKEIIDYIFNDIFSCNNPLSLEETKGLFANDILLPEVTTCALSGKDTWILKYENETLEKIASQESIADEFNKHEWMKSRVPINSIEEILKYWREIDYKIAEKVIYSENVLNSDSIFNSSHIYNSVSIFDSKNIIYSYKISNSNYLLCSRDSDSCTLGFRFKENLFCSSGFEVSYSNKVAKSMFIHDCYDLYECLFCSHIRSKKYCIANMQFEKEEYFRIKKLVIEWLISEKMR